MLKQISSVIFSVTITVMIMFASAGCFTERYVINVVDNSFVKINDIKRTYRIKEIKVFDVSNQIVTNDFNWLLRKSFKDKMAHNMPKVFSNSADSIPISIRIKFQNVQSSFRWTCVPFSFSLGILPVFYDNTFSYSVYIQRLDNMEISSGNFFTYNYSGMGTLLSPIGLCGCYSDIPNSTYCKKARNCVLFLPIGGIDEPIIDLLVETVSKITVNELCKLEENDEVAKTTKRLSSPINNILSDQIRKLKELRDAGTITEKEYQDMVLRATERVK